MSRLSRILLNSSFFILHSSLALAVSTSHWTHTTEADFKKGSFHNVVATNLGDLKLSRAVKTLLDQEPKVSSVYCLAEAPDHTIYAGTGPQGALLQIKDDKVTTVLTLEDDTNILSLLITQDGALLIGTGGDEGKILRIDHPGDKPKELFKSKRRSVHLEDGRSRGPHLCSDWSQWAALRHRRRMARRRCCSSPTKTTSSP